jgi:L-seryl-tRNA(Ser) seleniumtransferase
MLMAPPGPLGELAGWAIAVRPDGLNVVQLAEALRRGNPAVVGQPEEDRLLLNLRSVPAESDMQLVEAFENQEQPA